MEQKVIQSCDHNHAPLWTAKHIFCNTCQSKFCMQSKWSSIKKCRENYEFFYIVKCCLNSHIYL